MKLETEKKDILKVLFRKTWYDAKNATNESI
jgi:hypothetical protein